MRSYAYAPGFSRSLGLGCTKPRLQRRRRNTLAVTQRRPAFAQHTTHAPPSVSGIRARRWIARLETAGWTRLADAARYDIARRRRQTPLCRRSDKGRMGASWNTERQLRSAVKVHRQSRCTMSGTVSPPRCLDHADGSGIHGCWVVSWAHRNSGNIVRRGYAYP